MPQVSAPPSSNSFDYSKETSAPARKPIHDRWVGVIRSFWVSLILVLSLGTSSLARAETSAAGAPSPVAVAPALRAKLPTSAAASSSLNEKALSKNLQKQHEGSDAPPSAQLKMPAIPNGFSSYDGGWIQMAYHPSLSARVRVLQEQAAEVKAQLTTLLGRPVLRKVHVRIGRTAGEMETLAPQAAGFPKYASGVAYSEMGLVLLTARSRHPGERHDLPEVFRHELAHIALHDAVGRDNVPRWFNEGFAIHASKENQTARLQTLWTATLADTLLPFEQIRHRFPRDDLAVSIAYAQAADLLRFLLRRDDTHRFSALIRRLSNGQDFDSALLDAYQTSMSVLETEWREDVARRYTFWPIIFGGSLIWVFAFGLMIGGYVRRKKRAQKKLDRWAKEEALEDARKELASAMLRPSGAQMVVQENVSIADSLPQDRRSQVRTPRALPTVEHDGERHTLH